MITFLIIILLLICLYIISVIPVILQNVSISEFMTDIKDSSAAYSLNDNVKDNVKDYMSEMPVYVINLKSRPKRKERAADELNKYNIKHTFIEAVDGSTLDRDKLTDEGKIRCNGSYRELRKGEIGCYLSHIQCWKNILDSGNEYGLVLEDDVVFANDFMNKFNEMFDQIVNKDWDIICLGRRCKEYFKKCDDGHVVADNVLYPETLGYGTYAYIIKASAINKLLQTTYPIMRPIDVVIIDEHHKKNITVMGLIDSLVTVVDVKNSDTMGIK